MRGMAALAVVFYHAAVWSSLTETDSALAPYLGRLDVGVTVFFLLSGFLLYRPFVRARLLGQRVPSTGAYGWRRALRILPAYWVALTLVALLMPKPDVFEPRNAVIYYGFLQTYSDLALGGLPHAWSLGVELIFYAFLPLWAFALRRLRVPATVRAELIGLAALAAVAVVWNVIAVASAPDASRAGSARLLGWFPAYLDHFAIGMALAVASVAAERDGALPRPLAWLERRAWPAWAWALAAFVVVSVGAGLSPRNALFTPLSAGETLVRHWMYAAVAIGVLLPAAFGPPARGAIRRFLGQRWILWVGLVSYGLYLWHFPVIEYARVRSPALGGASWSDFATLLALGAGGGVVAAAVSWYVLEKPLLRLKRLVRDRAVPPRDPETHLPEPQPPVHAGAR